MVQNKVNGLLGLASKAGKIVFGSDAVIEAIYKKKVNLVIISEDSSEKTKNKFIEICSKNNVKYKVYGTIEDNSKAIGKDNKAIIAVKDLSLAEAVLERINGGEAIG
ncbi:MAG: ribosomal L7Ae/L30e/S12e/Gadd45 family protein [Clostridia bacterium]|nr:ribosomal L7Ae/L30e/S12e/Gadd45 family protein [Clostridia bacterium]